MGSVPVDMPGIVDQDPVFAEDTSPTAGSGGAIELDLEKNKADVDCAYDVSTTNGDIVVEVSRTGDFNGEEWEHTRLEQANGDVNSGGDLFQINTEYQHVRMFAGSGFSDSDVNELEMVSRTGVY